MALVVGDEIYLSSIRRTVAGLAAMFTDYPVSQILETCVVTNAEISVGRQLCRAGGSAFVL